MKKKLILVLIGMLPFVVGFLMHSWLIENPNRILPFKLIGIIFLVIWILVGFITCKYATTTYQSALIIHLPALIVLFLVMYQDMVLEEFWSNFFGLATQFYYLPLINIASFISGFVMTVSVYAVCIVAFLLMYGSYYVGGYFKNVISSK